MSMKHVGLNLAKQVFQVFGVNAHQRVVCRWQLKRAHVLDLFRQLGDAPVDVASKLWYTPCWR